MVAKINREGCISCGLCTQICPEVFYIADDGLADVKGDKVPPANEAEAYEAQENCPVSVIDVE
ncbi:MAG: ferredoxin [Oscillospiraceae bacterium]|nr:ferredoxin [Oscillospiraceae bacterium]